MMEYKHGDMPAAKAHAEGVGYGGGHAHEPGTPEHAD